MKAQKLPSGKWRVQAYSHKENGKEHYVSFTAPTKAEALRRASEFSENRTAEANRSMTVGSCIDKYISLKESVLSPSTIAVYLNMRKNYYGDIEDVSLAKLNSEILQKFVSDFTVGRTAKTVKNAYGLLHSSVSMFTDKRFTVTLPATKPPVRSIPTDDDVKMLMDKASDKMKICIALASIGTLRRGEICGLKYKDIVENAVYVHSDVVYNKNGEYIHKDMPKNSQSIRIVPLPDEVIELLGEGDPEDYIYPDGPKTITNRFFKLTRRVGLKCSFHDLRHYAASIMHAIGIPDVYIMERGGWKTDNVLKAVYRNALSDKSKEFSDVTNEYFAKKILQ